MSRKKAEFKNLGTLPMGEWSIIQHRDGAIILACGDQPPKIISEGQMKDLNPLAKTMLGDAIERSKDANQES